MKDESVSPYGPSDGTPQDKGLFTFYRELANYQETKPKRKKNKKNKLQPSTQAVIDQQVTVGQHPSEHSSPSSLSKYLNSPSETQYYRQSGNLRAVEQLPQPSISKQQKDTQDNRDASLRTTSVLICHPASITQNQTDTESIVNETKTTGGFCPKITTSPLKDGQYVPHKQIELQYSPAKIRKRRQSQEELHLKLQNQSNKEAKEVRQIDGLTNPMKAIKLPAQQKPHLLPPLTPILFPCIHEDHRHDPANFYMNSIRGSNRRYNDNHEDTSTVRNLNGAMSEHTSPYQTNRNHHKKVLISSHLYANSLARRSSEAIDCRMIKNTNRSSLGSISYQQDKKPTYGSFHQIVTNQMAKQLLHAHPIGEQQLLIKHFDIKGNNQDASKKSSLDTTLAIKNVSVEVSSNSNDNSQYAPLSHQNKPKMTFYGLKSANVDQIRGLLDKLSKKKLRESK